MEVFDMEQVLTIKEIKKVTHNVLGFTLARPDKMSFVPGQATRIAVNKDGWRDEGHSFTFTSLPFEKHIEFIIKIYPEHKGVTNELSKLEVGDSLILKDVYGVINFKGKGTFIAGGAGVTPFISILRDLKHKGKLAGNRLIFANDRKQDIINKEEFESILGDDFLNILLYEEVQPYAHGYIDTGYLRDNITSLDDYFYICGPEPMMDAVEASLKELGVKENQIVKEVF